MRRKRFGCELMDDLLVACIGVQVWILRCGMGGEGLMVLMRLGVVMLRSERGSRRLMRLSRVGR